MLFMMCCCSFIIVAVVFFLSFYRFIDFDKTNFYEKMIFLYIRGKSAFLSNPIFMEIGIHLCTYCTTMYRSLI